MPLLKLTNGSFLPAVEEPLNEVAVADWRENPQAHSEATALVVASSDDIAEIGEGLETFSVIILEFPTFKDGRAYSQARLLRERYGYEGEIRARGNVLRDQIFFMARCGIDGFELENGDAASANEALAEFTFAYQRAADKGDPVWRQRLSEAKAA